MVETARPRMRPALTCGRPAGPTVNTTWIWPPRRSVIAKGMVLYGTCTICTRAFERGGAALMKMLRARTNLSLHLFFGDRAPSGEVRVMLRAPRKEGAKRGVTPCQKNPARRAALSL